MSPGALCSALLGLGLVNPISTLVPSITSRRSSLTPLAGQYQDEVDYFGMTRRELVSWAPVLAAALASTSVQPEVCSAEPPTEATILKQEIPFSSFRQYKRLKMNNGLEVLLVFDRRTVRAAAAISIAGAGQFSDPEELPGCAHLMEHLILSSTPRSLTLKSLDFEDFMAEVEGASNAFTGYEEVCFHFNTPPQVINEALARFAGLFNEPDVKRVCSNDEVLKREIRRVSSELDFDSTAMQEFYLVKDMMNPDHPYSKFACGNMDTLERRPKDDGVNVGDTLFQFYRDHYQPSSASLVVIAPYEFSLLERWVAPFSSILSRERNYERTTRLFPSEALRADRKMRQVLLYRPKIDFPLKQNIETLSMHWPLNLDYNPPSRGGGGVVTAAQIGFVLSQILGRRGPGSLYYILYRRGYLPPGNQGVPRISLPTDISGFQLLKLDISLTYEGFVNRAVVAGCVLKAINSVFSGSSMTRFLASRQILSQYAVVAQLHGYILAPRPPDNVELASDEAMNKYTQKNDDPSEWSRFPLESDRPALYALQKAVRDTLVRMSDPSNAIIITTATDRALARARQSNFIAETVPAVAPVRWQSAKLTGAKYHKDDILRFTGIVGEFAANVDEDELLPPLTNNLIPPTLRPPRGSELSIDVNEGRNENWKILAQGLSSMRLRTPRNPPEKNCRCAFVFQLLSPRPARANTRKAAYAELWKVSFEKTIVDLAELGVPAGLAYDMSFNKFGMRLCFLGISQNIASYSRRFSRRLVQHHRELLKGSEFLDQGVMETALYDAMRFQGISALRKREIERALKATSAYEAATEAIAFFRSCRGGCAFSQGDLTPAETSALFNDLRTIFREELGSFGKSESSTLIPSIDDLIYTPVWKPRFGSSCNVPGLYLLSDSCGRVPR